MDGHSLAEKAPTRNDDHLYYCYAILYKLLSYSFLLLQLNDPNLSLCYSYKGQVLLSTNSLVLFCLLLLLNEDHTPAP
jgi:hypothetical protein